MNIHEISTIEALRLLGYRVYIWPSFGAIDDIETLEITDLRTAATIYAALEGLTLEQVLAAIEAKNAQFSEADKQ